MYQSNIWLTLTGTFVQYSKLFLLGFVKAPFVKMCENVPEKACKQYCFNKKETKISLSVHQNYGRRLLLTKVSLILCRTSSRVFYMEKSAGASPCLFPPGKKKACITKIVLGFPQTMMKQWWRQIQCFFWAQKNSFDTICLLLSQFT